MRFVTLIISLLFITNSYAQTEYKVKRLDKNTIISVNMDNSKTIDTLSVPESLSKKHSYVKIIDKNTFMSSFYHLPPMASFNSSFIIIGKWIMQNGIFECINSVKVLRKRCKLTKTSFKLFEYGIEWKVRRGLFRKSLTGFILFDDYSDKEYIINCIE